MRTLLGTILLYFLWNTEAKTTSNKDTLRLVHAVFRHGNRNPIKESLWESNPYYNESYYPEGYEQLTNEGKRRVYELGRILRKRYDSFLGDTWNINYMDVRSTADDRTKISAELVAAGLWHPKGDNIWNWLIRWQPIPYNYMPSSQDPLLSPFFCRNFKVQLLQTMESEQLNLYLAERYNETMRILSEHTGINRTSYFKAFQKFNEIVVQDELGFPPEEWIQQVYPEPLRSLAVDMYYIFSNNTAMRQIMAGTLLKKILTDTEAKINGTITPSTRKIFLYSAHEMNVAGMLLSLEVFRLTETPAYGSTVIFEVHEIDGVYGLKMFYINYRESNLNVLVLPGCSQFCPLDEFQALVEEIIPTSDVCGNDVVIKRTFWLLFQI